MKFLKNLKNKSIIASTAFFTFPALLFAQSRVAKQPGTLKELICNIVRLLLDAVPFIVVFALILFFWGLIKYVSNGDNEEKRSAGIKMMIYGIVGLFIMIAVWGILKIMVASFGFSFGVPQFKATGSGFKGVCSSAL